MADTSITPILTGLLASVAWFLSLFSGVYCDFLTNTLTTGNTQDQGTSLHYGIWTYRGFLLVSDTDEAVVYQTCKSYPDGMYLDAKWKSAMAFSTMAIVIGAAVTLWALFASCGDSISKTSFRIAGMTLLLCCFFQGLTMLFMASTACTNNEITSDLQASAPLLGLEDTCDMSVGAKCSIAAIVFWFVAAIPALKVDIPPLGAVDTEKKATTDEKAVDPDSKLFDKEEAAGGEEIGDEHTLETTEAA